jgi:hypothetical protein
MAIMKITVTRSGGPLGTPVSYDVDTTTLPDDQAHSVESLVATLPSALAKTPSNIASPDAFQYDITAEHAGASNSWSFTGEGNPGGELYGLVRSFSSSDPDAH